MLLLFLALLNFAPPATAQVDTVPPVLTCKANLPWVMIGQFCQTTLLASEFIDSIADNSSYYELGVRKACTGTGFPAQNIVNYYANEFGPQKVEIWAKDSSGNTSNCEVPLFIADFTGICDPGSGLSFRTVEGDGIDSVFTRITGQNCNFDSVNYQIPDSVGWGYFWESWTPGSWMNYGSFVPSAGYTFDIIPYQNLDPLNGVTTYDLSLISRHILGTAPLDSPYKIIAADINQDGKVTTFDVLLLRKLILGITTELPNGKSWRFLPENFQFPNPNNPFAAGFPEKITVPNTFEYSSGNYRFIGIKIGDLNFSANPN